MTDDVFYTVLALLALIGIVGGAFVIALPDMPPAEAIETAGRHRR
jgi:hypothetical protein